MVDTFSAGTVKTKTQAVKLKAPSGKVWNVSFPSFVDILQMIFENNIFQPFLPFDLTGKTDHKPAQPWPTLKRG